MVQVKHIVIRKHDLEGLLKVTKTSQAELVRQTGISYSLINQAMRRGLILSEKQWDKIEKYLNTKIANL